MPVHLDSIIPEERRVNAFAALLSQDFLDKPETIYISEDKKFLHLGSSLVDASDGTANYPDD